MKEKITLTIEKSRGYSGNKSAKSYIAEISGLDNRYGFARNFLDANEIDWRDSALYRKAKGSWDEKYSVGPGLYEVCQYGEKWFRLVGVWTPKDKPTDIYSIKIDQDRALKIGGLMDDGWEIDEARRLSVMGTERIDAIAGLVNDGGKTFEEAIAATKVSTE